jgi:hypothetical protein
MAFPHWRETDATRRIIFCIAIGDLEVYQVLAEGWQALGITRSVCPCTTQGRHHRFLAGKNAIKVRQIRNGFFKPRIPPKNERKNSFFWPNRTINEFFRSFFGGIRGCQKVLSKLLTFSGPHQQCATTTVAMLYSVKSRQDYGLAGFTSCDPELQRRTKRLFGLVFFLNYFSALPYIFSKEKDIRT